MNFISTDIENLIIVEPKIFKDSRGYFFESYNKKHFTERGLDYNFLQDNESYSSFGTLRGLHFQTGAFAQAKLVRVTEGMVWDVAVDLRPSSITYKNWFGVNLSSENKRMLLIPRGFAHGFIVLSSNATFSYKVDNHYSQENESGIAWNDSTLNIDWKLPLQDIILSDKDSKLPTL